MLKGVAHFRKTKGLTFQHMQIILGVEMLTRLAHGKQFPRASDIASLLGLREKAITADLTKLVEFKYLHEKHETYGELVMRYKLGAVGGTLMRQFLNGGRLRPDTELSD